MLKGGRGRECTGWGYVDKYVRCCTDVLYIRMCIYLYIHLGEDTLEWLWLRVGNEVEGVEC